MVLPHCTDGKTEAWKDVNCLFQFTAPVRGKGTLEPRIFAFQPQRKICPGEGGGRGAGRGGCEEN